jgi:LysM repeat protein
MPVNSATNVASTTALSTAQAKSQTYKVKAGDTLSEIGERFHVYPQVLGITNHLKDLNSLKVGQVLNIPDSKNLSPSTVATAVGKELGLGKKIGQDAGAGQVYVEFEKATLHLSNATGGVVGLEYKAPVGPTGTKKLSRPIIDAAMYSMLGSFKGAQGAAGSVYYDFARGSVRYSNVTKKVEEVKVHKPKA